MSDLRQAAQMALDALDVYGLDYMHGLPKKKYVDALRAALAQPEPEPLTDDEIKCIKPVCADFVSFRKREQAWKILRAALAQPEQEPEPVAWLYSEDERVWLTMSEYEAIENATHGITPLYEHQPQRKPLTDQEAKVLWADVYEPEPHIWVIAERFKRAIERAHGIGGEK